MLLSHSNSLLTTVSRDSRAASLSPWGESEHHHLGLLSSVHPPCLQDAVELHNGRRAVGSALQPPKHQERGAGQIVLGFLTDGAAGPPHSLGGLKP